MNIMAEWINDFSDMVVSDRGWSWSFVGILYLLLTMIIRNWFLRPILHNAKELKRHWYHEMKDAYLKRALPGWLCYLSALVIVLFIWSRPQLFPLTLEHAFALLLSVILYFFSILFHVQALGVAAVVTLKRIEDEKC